MNPPLPLVAVSPTYAPNLGKENFDFGRAHPVISAKGDLEAQAEQSQKTLKDHHAFAEDHLDKWDTTNGDEAQRVDSQFGDEAAITAHLSESVDFWLECRIKYQIREPRLHRRMIRQSIKSRLDLLSCILRTIPSPWLWSTGLLADVSVLNDKVVGWCKLMYVGPGHGDTLVPQDQAFLAGFKFAKHEVFV